MRFLTPLKALFPGRPSAQRDLAVTQTETKQIAVSKWTDDFQLRELARESKEKITNWVLASDMLEFFTKLDAFNEGRSEADQVKMRLTGDLSEQLKMWREKGFHKASELPGPTNGVIVVEGENVLRYFGPQYINDNNLRFDCNGQSAQAYYSAGVFNTNINIRTPKGWAVIEFGMDQPFGAAFKAQIAALPSLDI